MIKSTAAIAGGRVYAASLNGEVFCLDLKTGERQWTYKSQQRDEPECFIPGFKAAVAVTADTVYVGDEEGMFHAIDRGTGKGKWTFEPRPRSPAARVSTKTTCCSPRTTTACIA